ncbi:histidine kinase [Nonomuraea sp. NPDC050643]|uniref:sensor histidine kinase n=1 Tax=Nonomuraea sp. NPDC050643 TaxID=3155660 RepID=UPI0033FC3B96
MRGVSAWVLVVAVASAGLSVGSPWWAVVTMAASFVAGLLPGRARVAAFALVATVAAGVVAVSVGPAWVALGDRFVAVVVGAAMVPWFGGRFWRQYRELVRAGWERAEQLEREQRLVAERARLRERNRIAQDMHDELGHDLSLIALAAGSLKLAPDLPETHRASARDLRARAGNAVDRLGEIVGLLREPGSAPDPAGAAAGSSSGQVEGLVRAAAAAGLPVTLRVEGAPGEMSAAADRAIYRVVQEGLTNAVKHAPGAPVTVRVRHTRAETQVRVENALERGARPGLGNGGRHGLTGLDERVRLAGGILSHGPSEDGGFAVEAHLPHTPASPGTSPPGVGDERRRVRRDVGRTLAIALMLPLLTAVLTGGVLRTWELLATRQSVLATEGYAALRPGLPRAELSLPPRQAARRPATAHPGCEYYAMTSDPLHDRYGDTYRLCFDAGRLVSADALVAR